LLVSAKTTILYSLRNYLKFIFSCSEEWEWLRNMSGRHKKDNEDDSEEGKTELNNKVEDLEPSEQQKAFTKHVAATAKRLLNYMEVSPDDAFNHR